MVGSDANLDVRLLRLFYEKMEKPHDFVGVYDS